MPRANQRREVTLRVQQYLAIGEMHSSEEYPLDVRSVAAALKISPTTIYTYDLNKEINAAQERQRKNGKLSGKALERRSYTDIIQDLKAELERERERSKGLVARFALIEVNAARLGFDPEELYKPIAKPLRSVSRAGQSRNRNRQRSRR